MNADRRRQAVRRTRRRAQRADAIGRIVFANSRAEAAAIGFCDDELYSELNRHFNERSIVMEHRPLAGSLAPLEHWSGNPARIAY